MSDDRAALAELTGLLVAGATYAVEHYLYVPTREAAEAMGSSLSEQGFRVNVRLGADGIDWLLLASHDVVVNVDTITSARLLMQTLAAQHAGEYDGWEVDLATKRLPRVRGN